MGLFPNLIASGCHTKQPKPKNKNIYPVPEFKSFSVRTVEFDIGVRTEYTDALEMPTVKVNLQFFVSVLISRK